MSSAAREQRPDVEVRPAGRVERDRHQGRLGDVRSPCPATSVTRWPAAASPRASAHDHPLRAAVLRYREPVPEEERDVHGGAQIYAS